MNDSVHPAHEDPLHDVAVLDLSTGANRYCGRLLAHLGATVTAPAPDPSAGRSRRDPLDHALDAGAARLVAVPGSFASAAGRELLGAADVLITSTGPARLRARGLHPEQLAASWPELVHVSISPYGLTGPWADRQATDLTLLAAGGLLYLGGDPDRPPVRPYGEQSAIAASLHAATATLMALLARDTGQGGQTIDVSVQEAVAHSTENVVQYFDCEHVVRRRAGAGSAEAGTGLFACRDGYVYLLTSMGGVLLGWARLVEWLLDEHVPDAELLTSDRWADAAHRRAAEAKALFTTIFERFACSRTKLSLYEDGQKRGISIAPVSGPADLLANEQLRVRGFFRPTRIDGRDVLLPGRPFRITPVPDSVASPADQG